MIHLVWSTMRRVRCALFGMGAALSSFLMVAAPAAAQQADPVAIFNALHAAVNAHDINAAIQLFTDDAVVSFPNQPPPNEYRGTQAIRAWLEGDAAQHIQVATENLQVSGDRLTWTARVDTDDLRAAGVTAVGTVEAVMRDGKFASFAFTLSDETIAKLQAATPQALPQTGGAGQLPALALSVAGLAAAAIGLWLRSSATPRLP